MRALLRTTLRYGAAVLVSLLVLAGVMQLWRADLSIPFSYAAGGDATFHATMIKGVMLTGSYLYNPELGAPFGLDMHDFPLPEFFYFLLIRAIGFFTNNYAVTLNLFFLLSFPLCVLSALAVFDHYQIAFPLGMAGGILFAFLPYHFMRGEFHLPLAAYFHIPLAILVALWLLLGEPLFDIRRGVSWRSRAVLLTVAAALICVYSGSSGAYYAFFTSFLLLVAGAVGVWQQKRWRPGLAAVILVGFVSLALLGNLVPLLQYQQAYGGNAGFGRPIELTTIFGLNLAQLLLPVTGHRLQWLADLKTAYSARTIAPLLVNENDFATLGLFGSIGFVFLLAWLIIRRAGSRFSELLTALAALNLSALLLGTTGGLGALFATLVSGEIRAYNRISIYIAFVAIFALLILAELARRRWAASGRRATLFYGAWAVVVVLALLDQTTAQFVPAYDLNQQAYAADAAFVRSIESSVPVGGSIFQLPYAYYPEGGSLQRMADYDHFKPFLHSAQLRWSFGVMKNRDGDGWQYAIASQPPGQMAETLVLAGYDGIYLDRFGFADSATALEQQLQGKLAGQPVVSQNGRYAFFSLAPLRDRLRARYDEQQWQQAVNAVLYPPLVQWSRGFSTNLTDGTANWHWSAADGELYIDNPTAQAKPVSVTFQVATAFEAPWLVQIDSEWFSQRLSLSAQPQTISRSVVLAPGRHLVRFRTDAPRSPLLGMWDFRFRVIDLRVQEQ